MIASLDSLATPQFYRHSGAVPGRALLAATFWVLGTGILGGMAYGFLGFWEHIELPPLLALPAELITCLFFAYVLGGNAVGAMLDWKGRSYRLGYALTALSVILGLYFSWWAWLANAADTHLSNVELLNPLAIAHLMASTTREGGWAVVSANSSATGVLLWTVWVAEAILIVTVAFWNTRRKLGGKVFCEKCLTWCEGPRYVMQFAPSAAETLRENLLGGRRTGVTDVPRSHSGAREWCELYLEICPKCSETSAATFTRAGLTQDRGPIVKRKTLLRRLLLAPRQTQEIVAASTARDDQDDNRTT